ncbi:MAG: monovalent cation/H+ antiporter complex subunit F [Thermoleophilia bacterium]|nr:monovalent cation/H+ antiporter complex subunit F [Gaiellaceae bacterium]MDW8339015.1 monovalent cation/H+ antiporter complex subunit F [Thermoleophilia bacterium]
MHVAVFYAAVLWMTVLLATTIVLVIRTRSVGGRIIALDMAILILVALLVLLSDVERVPYFLDAALALALLSFVATIAAARYYETEGDLFS